MSKLSACLMVCSILLSCLGRQARAQDTYVYTAPSPPPAYAPPVGYPPPYAAYPAPPPPVPYARPYRRAGSVFAFGFRGLFTGALAGLGASYFAARDARHPAQAIGLGLSIGALAGTGLGLSLGLLDRVGLPSAYYVSRDLTYGVLLGAALGAIGGGISTLGGGSGKDVLFGAAAGSLGGLGLGLVVGIIEGQFRRPVRGFYAKRTSLSVARLDGVGNAWGMRVAGSF